LLGDHPSGQQPAPTVVAPLALDNAPVIPIVSELPTLDYPGRGSLRTFYNQPFIDPEDETDVDWPEHWEEVSTTMYACFLDVTGPVFTLAYALLLRLDFGVARYKANRTNVQIILNQDSGYSQSRPTSPQVRVGKNSDHVPKQERANPPFYLRRRIHTSEARR